MGKGTYLDNRFLDAIFGQTSLPAIATVYVALFTATPGAGGGGTEVTGNAYARAAVTNNTSNFPNASAGSKSNGAIINFPTPTGNWGTITSFAIFDAVTGGNLLYFGNLASSMAAGLNNAVSLAIGALSITEA